MLALDQALSETAELYATAGGDELRVVIDDSAIAPPCLWLALDRAAPRALDGERRKITFAVTLIAPDVGQLAALKIISKMEAIAVPVLGQEGDSEMVGVQVAGAGLLPALRFVTSIIATP